MVKLERDFTNSCKIVFEKDIAIGDFTYDVIYGEHINGGFICIPDHGIGCEASTLNDYPYNAEKMHAEGLSKDVAWEIAKFISQYYEEDFEI